jgi:hypothetical protein
MPFKTFFRAAWNYPFVSHTNPTIHNYLEAAGYHDGCPNIHNTRPELILVSA